MPRRSLEAQKDTQDAGKLALYFVCRKRIHFGIRASEKSCLSFVQLLWRSDESDFHVYSFFSWIDINLEFDT